MTARRSPTLRLVCSYCGDNVLWFPGPAAREPEPDAIDPLDAATTFMYCVERTKCGATWSSVGFPVEPSRYAGGRWRALWRFVRSSHPVMPRPV